MSKRLSGKVAIITGGTSGIGCTTAILFASEGAKVAIVGRNEQRGIDIVQTIEASKGEAMFIQADVSCEEDCQRMAHAIFQSYGRIDVLFNNAGIVVPQRTLLETTEQEWDRTMAVNAKGVFLVSKAVVPYMISNAGGSIINNSSYYGLVGGETVAAYSASKGAVTLLTKCMALELARNNIRVNCICPGSVDTPMLQEEMEAQGDKEEVLKRFSEKHPLCRIGSSEEIARLVLYLATEESSFITGAAIPIDGGITAK